MKCNNYKIDNKISYICKNQFQYFLNKSNVVGVGMGYKVKNGLCTNIKCIKVLVSKKLLPKQLFESDIIPNYYKGIPIDVEESGIIESASLTQRIRPVQGGYSMGLSTNIQNIGSVACLVKHRHDKYFLGANHVLADGNFANIETPITQPCIHDGGIAPRDIVGRLFDFYPLQYSTENNIPDNYVDCALVKPISPQVTTSNIAFIGKPCGIASVQLGQNVQKSGRTTGHTLGKIRLLGATIQTQFTRGTLLFKEQIGTTIMTGFGDSGSLLLDLVGFGVGLSFAQSNTFSYYNPIKFVLDALDVNIVTD